MCSVCSSWGWHKYSRFVVTGCRRREAQGCDDGNELEAPRVVSSKNHHLRWELLLGLGEIANEFGRLRQLVNISQLLQHSPKSANLRTIIVQGPMQEVRVAGHCYDTDVSLT